MITGPQLKYFLLQKKFPIGRFSFTLFEIALVLGFLYYSLVVNPKVMIQVVPLIIAVVFHEVAHGYVAYRFGDPTAKKLGRITLNPLPHVDPLGTVILPLLLILSGSGFLIAWAKPVPVNPDYFKDPVKGMMWVAIAGPLTNVTLAVISSVILKGMVLFGVPANLVTVTIAYLLQSSIVINLVLAIFNMFPIPPLDGSKVLTYFLPIHLRPRLYRLEPYGMIIIVVMAFLGVFSIVIGGLLPPILNVLL